MFSSPLKPKKIKEDDSLKKPKPVISKATAKKILNMKSDPDHEWVQRWCEQLCRERSLPLQWIGPEFKTKIETLLEAQDALNILSRVREEYSRDHPFQTHSDEEEAFKKELETFSASLINERRE